MQLSIEKLYRNLGIIVSLLLCLVFWAFYRSYFGTFPRYFFCISGIVHFHVGTTLLFVMLLIVQFVFIRSERLQSLKMIRRLGNILFPIMILSAFPLLFQIWLRGDNHTLWFWITIMLQLVIFYVLLVINRKRIPIYLSYLTTLLLVVSSLIIAKIIESHLKGAFDVGSLSSFFFIDFTLLALVFWDWKKERNIKPYLLALGILLLFQISNYKLFLTNNKNLSNATISMNKELIENAEIDAWLDLFAAQPSNFSQQQEAESAKIDNVSIFLCKKIPFPHFNIALDLGVRSAFTEKTLDAILNFFREKGISKFYLQFTPITQPQNAPDWFTARGLRHVSSWHRIARSNEPLSDSLSFSGNFLVEEVTANNAEEWANFIDKVYGMPTKPWLLKLVGRSGWHSVICRQDGAIIAARSMKINTNGTAYFCIDAPVPGIMTQNFEADYVLSRHLIEIGLANGVKLLTADIEKPSLEQDTPAYQFWKALGFQVVYEKQNFMF